MTTIPKILRTVSGQYHPAHFEHPITGTENPELYKDEIWGPEFTYKLEGLEPGEYTLILGFSENFFNEAGKRVFNVYLDDTPLIENLDVAKEVGPKASLELKFPVKLGTSLTLHFKAVKDHAKVSRIILYNDKYYFEDSARSIIYGEREGACPEGLYETIISKFGSRLSINFCPQNNCIRISPLGRYYDVEGGMLLGCRVGEVARALPFSNILPTFSRMHQEITMSTVSFTCEDEDLPCKVIFTFTAPFYPKDEKLTLAPFLYLDVSVENKTDLTQPVDVYIGLPLLTEFYESLNTTHTMGYKFTHQFAGKDCQLALASFKGNLQGVTFHPSGYRQSFPPRKEPIQKDKEGRIILRPTCSQRFTGVIIHLNLAPRSSLQRNFIIAGYTDAPLLDVKGKLYPFKYTQFFPTIEDVVEYAASARDTILHKTRIYDATVLDASIAQEAKDFIAFSFQSFASNAWWMSKDGKDWFSVWEGCCRFHSTVDVEYNYGLWYFQYWPELLGILLDEWPDYIVEFPEGPVISHDMGWGLEANHMAYPHHMEIEENTNYILLLHQYWKYTGDLNKVKKHFPLVCRLLEFCLNCDTNDNGFPDKGTANTVDQGSPAVQYAKEQTYLAVRILASLEAACEFARALGEEENVPRWREEIKKINKTLAEKAWLGDHYAVCLPHSKEELRDIWTGEPIGEGTIEGWDAYSIYASNGLLYLLRSSTPVECDISRMKEDIINATKKTFRKYGSPHSTIEDNMWVSQNLWRDFVAAYLGVDMLDHIKNYWELEKYINTQKQGCFTDVYVYNTDGISLDYYPRGITGIGILYAMAGLSIDVPAKTIKIAPLRRPLRIPITTLANWEKEQIPWLEVTGKGVKLSPKTPIRGWKLEEVK